MAASSTTPARKALAAATAALLAALALWVSAGKPKYTPITSAVDTLAAVHTWHCPDSLPNALVVDYYRITDLRIAGDTLRYPRSTNAPIVTCGPASMIHDLVATPEAGHGVDAVVNVSDGTTKPYAVPSLTAHGDHLIAAKGARGIDPLISKVLALSGVTSDQPYAIAELADSGSMWFQEGLPPAVSFRYRPARGTRARTQLTESAGSCWSGDAWSQCSANGGPLPARTPSTWLAEWPAMVADLDRSSVYRLAVVIPQSGVTVVPTNPRGNQ